MKSRGDEYFYVIGQESLGVLPVESLEQLAEIAWGTARLNGLETRSKAHRHIEFDYGWGSGDWTCRSRHGFCLEAVAITPTLLDYTRARLEEQRRGWEDIEEWLDL